jgi:hypothetical protein
MHPGGRGRNEVEQGAGGLVTSEINVFRTEFLGNEAVDISLTLDITVVGHEAFDILAGRADLLHELCGLQFI